MFEIEALAQTGGPLVLSSNIYTIILKAKLNVFENIYLK
jgi:hypothetical protein